MLKMEDLQKSVFHKRRNSHADVPKRTRSSNLIKRQSMLPTAQWKNLPSIQQYDIASDKKRLAYLFNAYLKPTVDSALDAMMIWGKQFQAALKSIKREKLEEETMFIMDVIIYYLYYDIAEDKSKYPQHIPFVDLPSEMIEFLIAQATNIFQNQNALVRVKAPVKIFGDIHGQFDDVLHMFKDMQEREKAKNRLRGQNILNASSRYLFMGDYVNRGQQSTEVIGLLFALQVRFPDRIIMLRGNHESANITKVYGFYDECKRRHSIKLWNMFINAFNSMPLVALIEEKIMCMHGGISPSMESFKDLENFDRPLDIPSEGLITDLMWNDPDEEATEWTENERGCGQVFGVRQLEEFLKKFDLDLICRGHQVMEEGYGFFGEARQLVTIFSAKNYTGDFDNDAAVMSVDEKLQCSFNVFKGDFSKYEALQKKQTIKKKKVLEDKLSEPRKVFK